MSDFDGYEDVIGRASDLMPDDYVPLPPPVKEPVCPVASFEELAKPSPKPFKGRPDPDFPELDSLEHLYAPKFLLRRWGREKCARSAYWALWKYEAERVAKMAGNTFGPDFKPERKK